MSTKKKMMAIIGAGAPIIALVPTAGAGATEGGEDGPTGADEQHCIAQIADAQSSITCFDTAAEADALKAALTGGDGSGGGATGSGGTGSSNITVATHFESLGGTGSSISVLASTCAVTWYPTSWWQDNMSSTIPGTSCAAAKHYTGTNCSGSYQFASNPGFVTNLTSPLQNNVGCVKYA